MREEGMAAEQIVWLNGKFLPLNEAAISPFDRGFLFGDGLFETIRADKAHIHYLDEHLVRMRDSATELRLDYPESLPWREIITKLLELNDLAEATARIKLVITRGSAPEMGLPSSGRSTIFVAVRKYTPPSKQRYEEGWKLSLFEGGYPSSLARHKTLSYLYYNVARQAALDAGKDEAVILGPDGRVAETAAGSLLLRIEETWVSPENSYSLESITLRQVKKILKARGQGVESAPVSVHELLSARTTWVLNSMIGIMPACEVGGRTRERLEADLASSIRKELFFGPRGARIGPASAPCGHCR